jgi:hypothetical protein
MSAKTRIVEVHVLVDEQLKFSEGRAQPEDQRQPKPVARKGENARDLRFKSLPWERNAAGLS